MAENLTLARPYAEAVYALARDGGSLPSWANALERLASVAADAEAQALIRNPQLSPEQIASFLSGLGGNSAGELTAEQRNFVRLLVDADRATLLPEINSLFVTLKNSHDGVRDAVVSTAFPLDEAAIARLASDLEGRFGKLRLSVRLAPDLIGGVRVAVGDEVLDASVRGKLDAMAAALQI